MGPTEPETVTQTEPSGERPESSRRRATGCAIELVQTIVLTLVIFFGVQTLLAQPYQVEQQSMEETVEPGEYILVDKITPRFDDYRRGDVIVFNPPQAYSDGDRPFIKRIIGTGGDTIAVTSDGTVTVNGKELNEPYIYKNQPTQAPSGPNRWVVPAGDYFVMGDHRQASVDSRYFGAIERSAIIGRAWVRYWPLGRFGFLPSATATFTGIPAGAAQN